MDRVSRAEVTTTGNVLPSNPSGWTSSTIPYVGKTSYGNLDVRGGSRINSYQGYLGYEPDAEGSVAIHGDQSAWEMEEWLWVGWGGNGTLDIRSGGTVRSGYGYLGYKPGSEGAVTVEGDGSIWEMSDYLTIGRGGSGTMAIRNGGRVKCGLATLATNDHSLPGAVSPGASVTVRGLNSAWELNDSLTIGRSSTAILTIQDGGLVHSEGKGVLGFLRSSEGMATVSGMGAKWHTNGLLDIGHSGKGTLVVEEGGVVASDGGAIVGSSSRAAEGSAMVRGNDSAWQVGDTLKIAPQGTGTVTIRDGGRVTVTEATYVFGTNTFSEGGGGQIVFNDGILRTKSIWAYAGGLQGVGSIQAAGWMLDDDVVIHGSRLVHDFVLSDTTASHNIDMHIDQTGDDLGDVGAGVEGLGTLAIENGAFVRCENGHLGVHRWGDGTATVRGVGSTWEINELLDIGPLGTGKMNVSQGARVTCGSAYLGISGSGHASVSGNGTTWQIVDRLYLGGSISGVGKVSITDGSVVAAGEVAVRDFSRLAIDAGGGSLLEIGGGVGTMNNDGTVQVFAAAGAQPGEVYEPIAAGSFTGTGTYQAVGGTWDETNHQFTVSDAESGLSGALVTIDRSATQRVSIHDLQTDRSVIASFLSTEAPGELNLAATVAAGSTLTGLLPLLGPGESVRSAWEFEISGDHSPGDPAYLSFDLGQTLDPSDLRVWHYDGTHWSAYVAAELSCSGSYASFAVTDFSGYALSAVPEPCSTALLAMTALTLLGWSARRVDWRAANKEVERVG